MSKRFYELTPRGHVWQTDEDGEVDIFAFDTGGRFCNGPRCVNCGEGFCHHCEDAVPTDCIKPKEPTK